MAKPYVVVNKSEAISALKICPLTICPLTICPLTISRFGHLPLMGNVDRRVKVWKVRKHV